jgi:hypothetical protein
MIFPYIYQLKIKTVLYNRGYMIIMDGYTRKMISGVTADSYNYLQTQIDKVNKNKNIIAGNLNSRVRNTG